MFFNAFSALMFQSVASNLWLILTELKKKQLLFELNHPIKV